MSAILAQASKTSLDETSRDTKPGLFEYLAQARAFRLSKKSRSCEVVLEGLAQSEEPMDWATEHLVQARGTRLREIMT
ncbi:hypothetical protein DEO72_LG2g4004 [Vigna unguiculata]|uniref:Uncharacterized protein n=1 Tax=Vigna unguiculata TaxID=3917 RepID=A0A4D6L562_VIGUN|nr:hypothetical protein DEO72_LG2g4004 [Vigna unguiculata]